MKRIPILLVALSPAFAETTVLRNFTLIDGTGKPPAPGMAMIVTDGRITAIGPAAKIQPPQAAQVVDLAGKYVMPGIINLHGHVGAVQDLKQDAKFYTRESVERDLKTYASYGVTSIASLGGDTDLVFKLRSEQRAGRPRIARIFTAGRGFTVKGGYPPPDGIRRVAESKADVESGIAELTAQKVDLVKIWVDDHLGRTRKFPIDFASTIISNGHRGGLKVVAHIFYLEDAKALINAGLDGLAHSVRDRAVDQSLIDSMKKRGAWHAASTLTRELSTYIWAERPKFLDDPFFTRSVPKPVIDTLKSADYIDRLKADPDFPKYAGFLDMAKKNLKRLADAGVKFAFGTDTGPPARFQGYFEHLEMELMVDAGLTPARVIQAATGSAAEFLGAKDLGTLERGKWADLIVLSRDPNVDIKNTRSIESVYIAGNRVQ